MKQIYYVMSIIILITSIQNTLRSQTGWEVFGDSYPTGTTPPSYKDLNNFFILEGPGNGNSQGGYNPGNWFDYDQTDSRLRLSQPMKEYIAGHFKYVLFDQASFADWNFPVSVEGAREIQKETEIYHQEAEDIMNINPNIIVFPYFTFTLIDDAFPWWSEVNAHEDWFLHRTDHINPALRITSVDPNVYVMDVRNAGWRNFYANYIASVVAAHHYRGVFLDNMTTFPFVDAVGYSYLPNGVAAGWKQNLITFAQTVTGLLPANVTVVCNSLGIDDLTVNPQRLFGDDYGLDIINYVNGGALMESFHSTVYPAPFQIILNTILPAMRDNGKIFLGNVHYSKGVDSNLQGEFGLPPYPFPWNDEHQPPLETFYRMQMSYLARFLLITAHTGEQPFGFGFQPGFTNYGNIPYYKAWDEPVGTPTGDYTVNDDVYERDFTNCRVVVNGSASQKTMNVPAGDWYWFNYYGGQVSNNTPYSKVNSATFTLNRMEGVILYKKATVDQKLQSGESHGSIGHWETNQFVEYSVPASFNFTIGSTEVLRGSQEVDNSQFTQKYNNWDIAPDITNHHTFIIQSSAAKIISQLKSIQNDVTIHNELIDAPGIDGGTVGFHDPWLIDSTDASHGNAPLNRGQANAKWYDNLPSPFNPNTNSNYKGVFLGQLPAGDNAYYSARVPSIQQINGQASYFVHWSSTGATIVNPSSLETPVVFNNANDDVKALYKAHLGSSAPTVLTSNQQRKIVSSEDGRHFYMVYESAGKIWFTESGDQGETWGSEEELNTGNNAMNPSLAIVDGQVLLLTWSEKVSDEGDTYRIQFNRRWENRWLTPPQLLDISSSAIPPHPVITHKNGFWRGDQYEITLVVWNDNRGLEYKYALHNRDMDYFWYQNDPELLTADMQRPSITPVGNVQEVLPVYLSYDNGRGVFVQKYDSVKGGCGSSNYFCDVWLGEERVEGSINDNFLFSGNSQIIQGDDRYEYFVVWQVADNAQKQGEVSPLEVVQMNGSMEQMAEGENTVYSVYFQGKLRDGSWSKAQRFGDADMSFYNPTISRAECGVMYIAWTDGVNIWRTKTADDGEKWATMERVAEGVDPNLSVSGGESYYPVTSTIAYRSSREELPYAIGFRDDNSGDRCDVVHKEESYSRSYYVLDGTGTASLNVAFEPLWGTTVSGGFFEIPFYDSADSSDTTGGTTTTFLSTQSKLIPSDAESLFIPFRITSAKASDLTQEENDIFIKFLFSVNNGNVPDFLAAKWRAYTNHDLSGVLRVSAVDLREKNIMFMPSVTGIDESSTNFIVTLTDTKEAGGSGKRIARHHVKANDLPKEFALEQNYPNPFNPVTQIKYQLPQNSFVMLKVYDILGREVLTIADEEQAAGYKSVEFNASKFPSGVYIYKLTAGSFVETKKMVLLK